MGSLLRDRAAASAEMLEVFGDRALLAAALRFEAALAGAQGEEALIPAEAARAIRSLCADPDLDVAGLAEAAAHAGTLAIPLVAHLRERASGHAGVADCIHRGATSQDLADTALMLQAKAGSALIERDLACLARVLARLAKSHSGLKMLGRTLLQGALPISFGLKAANWMLSVDAALARFRHEAQATLALQFGGAAGTRAGLEGRGAVVAARMAEELGLACPALPWHTQRDGTAGLGAALAIVTGALGKIARDVALLAQGEVAEAFEPRSPGRGGSSAMAHKRNATGCQVALSAALRAPGLAATLLAAMPQEHERGLGGWQAEGAVLAELFCLAHGATLAMLPVLARLEIDPARMRQNLLAAGVGEDAGESTALVAAALAARRLGMIEFAADDGAMLRGRIEGPEGAPAVLLLHSLGCDNAMWAAQLDALRDRFRVIAPDARGHGASAAPEGAYTLDRLGRDALAVLDHAGVGVAHVCGISMGGLVAQWLAIEAPARVGRLVLANTASRIGSLASWQEREAVVRDQGLPAIADTVLARFFGAAFRATRPAVVARFRERLLSTPAQGYAGCCAALREADLSAQSGGIACRTLVIAGDADVSTPPALSQALAAAIPGARLLVLAASHLSNVEQEAAFSSALSEHLMAPEAA